MTSELHLVLLYVAMFGFSELIIDIFGLQSTTKKFIYYLFILCLSLVFYNLHVAQ